MSLIKSVGMHCPKCRTNTDEHRRTVLGGEPWMHCSFCDVDTVALYTRDDLLNAVTFTVGLTSNSMLREINAEADNIVRALTGAK